MYIPLMSIECMNFVKRYIAPQLTASLFDTVVKIIRAWAQARATPEKGDSQRVAMTAHFQVRTFEVRTLFQVVYSDIKYMYIEFWYCSSLVPKTHLWSGSMQSFDDQIWAWSWYGPPWMERSNLSIKAKRNCRALIQLQAVSYFLIQIQRFTHSNIGVT